MEGDVSLTRYLESELTQALAERDTAMRVALEVMRVLTEEQFLKVRQTLTALDWEGGFSD
jgi:hypothetical protein